MGYQESSLRMENEEALALYLKESGKEFLSEDTLKAGCCPPERIPTSFWPCIFVDCSEALKPPLSPLCLYLFHEITLIPGADYPTLPH